MAVDVDLLVDVVRRAAKCQSGMIEFPVPSAEQEAMKIAESAGYIRVIANGVAMVTQAGRRFAEGEESTMQGCQEPTESEVAEYQRLDAWRSRWQHLARKAEPGRLQSRQERIERRASISSHQILQLMRSFDKRIGNTSNPV